MASHASANIKGKVLQNISPSTSNTERPQGISEEIPADISSLTARFRQPLRLAGPVNGTQELSVQGGSEDRHLGLVLMLILIYRHRSPSNKM